MRLPVARSIGRRFSQYGGIFMKNNFLQSLYFIAVACFFLSTNAAAQTEKIINQAFQPLVDDKSHVGIVVGVIDKNGQKIFAYGS